MTKTVGGTFVKNEHYYKFWTDAHVKYYFTKAPPLEPHTKLYFRVHTSFWEDPYVCHEVYFEGASGIDHRY